MRQLLPTLKCALSASLCLSLPTAAFAFDLRHGEIPIQVGGFISSQGNTQNVSIRNSLGNQYTTDNHTQGNGLVGIGYFINGLNKDRFQISYGLNAFYLGATSVSGLITQEHLFTNLAYSYKTQNTPLYFAAKAKVKTNSEKYNVIFDAGIGPNFMRVSGYHETPQTNFSYSNYAFTSHNDVNFSATAGIGLRLNNVFNKVPLECGYRFFYLGQGQLAINNGQMLNALNTGNTYANALVCSVTV